MTTSTFDLGTDNLVTIEEAAAAVALFDSTGPASTLGHRLAQANRDIYAETVLATHIDPLGLLS